MKTRTSHLFVVGLLVVVGVFSDARLALAQTQQACPLPAGLTPLAAPPVTAQQVEDQSATLAEFALAVRDQHRALSREIATFEGEAYFGCLVRQEGSPYRSGSTFLVSLAADRVVVHSKAMALSGRRLNPLIYGTILRALGARRFTDLIAAANSDGSSFNVPGIPGASGYATVYMSPGLGIPVVLLAGFDLDSSHLVSEPADGVAPAVTARDVVDRETLKAFVTGAGHYFLELAKTGGRNAVWKAKHAMRDPNGPWRHGSVYLYVLDLPSNLTMFHGAFPDRYELLPLEAPVRDAVTGELVLPQVIEAAKSSPEGGFVQYFFDDPDDDTDSADIPKVGYARVFTGPFREPGERFSRGEFIIGSGFYLSSPEVVAARQNNAVESVLPQVMRAMTASTVDAVSGRIQQATAGTPPAKGVSLGGASTLSDALLANGQALENGTFDLGRLLADSSFTLPLNAADTGGSGPFGNLTLWGSGDYRNFSGGNSKTLTYDGNVVSAHVGADARLGADLLAGMAVAWARGMVDYENFSLTGESTTTLTSINSYVGWQAPSGLNLWATAGYGWGEVEIDDPAADAQASDLTQRMVAAGVNGPLASSDQLIEGGATSLRLKGETAFTWADVEGAGTIEAVNLNASRQRLMLEGRHVRTLASGATLTPSVEMGMRHDGGDGDTGLSLEIGGGLRYADPATGLTVEGRGRTVPVHGGDSREWGVNWLVRFDPGAAGLGLSFSVQPAWGHTASGVQRLWETGMIGGAAPGNQASGRVSARVAYGIGTTWGGRGVLTPHTDVSLSGEGARRLSLGGQFNIGSSVRMSLEGVHSRPVRGLTSHGVMLRGSLNW